MSLSRCCMIWWGSWICFTLDSMSVGTFDSSIVPNMLSLFRSLISSDSARLFLSSDTDSLLFLPYLSFLNSRRPCYLYSFSCDPMSNVVWFCSSAAETSAMTWLWMVLGWAFAAACCSRYYCRWIIDFITLFRWKSISCWFAERSSYLALALINCSLSSFRTSSSSSTSSSSARF